MDNAASTDRPTFTSPVVDYEPPAVAPGQLCPPPSPAALHRRRPHRLRGVARPAEPPPPHAAAVFAEAALRRVLEVIDRRRPAAQLKKVLSPALQDTVAGLARRPHTASATLRRVRLRSVHGDSDAAEVFATFARGRRVHAIAARVARSDVDGWRVIAMQIG